MNIKRLLIAEAEKKDILRQYGLIKEDNTQPKKTLEVDVRITFKGGYYSANYANFKNNLDPEIAKVTQFLKAGAGKAYLVTVEITSGESKLPNVDMEKGGVRVNPGYLSKERSKTIQKYITTKLEGYVNQKLLLALPTFKVVTPEPTGPDWVGQPFCPKNLIPADDPQGFKCTEAAFNPGVGANGAKIVNWSTGKFTTYSALFKEYQNAQFMGVKLKLEEMTDIKKCLDNMVIEVNYTNLDERHICNNATYHIYLVGGNAQPTQADLLYRDGDKKNYASLDNAGSAYDNKSGRCIKASDEGCKRYNKFTVTPEMANKVLTQSVTSMTNNKPKFVIWGQCSELNQNHPKWGNGCHASNGDPNAGVGDVVITNGLKEKTTYTIKTPVTRGQFRRLRTITACGTANN